MKISINQLIDIKFRIINTCYGVTAKGDVYNLKTGRKLRRVVIGLTKGYCLNGNFTSLAKIRTIMIKIEKTICPF